MKYSWFTTMLVILEIKVSLVSFKKSLYHYNPPYIREVSSHRVLYLKFLSSFYICIIYLHLIEACLEVTIAIFYFCHSKNSSDVMKNIFNSWKKIYILEKNFYIFLKKISLLTNIRNKGVIRKINLFFFDVMKNDHIFPWRVCHFQLSLCHFNHKDYLLVEKWGTLEHARRCPCKNLLNVDCQDSICFTFFKLFKNEHSFGKSFSFPFSEKCFDRDFKCFLSCTLPFLNIIKFEDSKDMKRHIFHYFH